MGAEHHNVPPPPDGSNPSEVDDRYYHFSATALAVLSDPETAEVMTLGRRLPRGDGRDGFLGYPVRGVATIPDAERRRALGRALEEANRVARFHAQCFIPHYGVRMMRDGNVVEMAICFWCQLMRVSVSGESVRMLRIGWQALPLVRRELRRGGVGWLWFWRRWLR